MTPPLLYTKSTEFEYSTTPINTSPSQDDDNMFYELTTAQTDIIKNYIKSVLNVDPNLEHNITQLVNLNDPDPMYVFMLPDQPNKTLILRKSNFARAIFPNITNIQMHIYRSNISKLFELIENIDRIKPKLMNDDEESVDSTNVNEFYGSFVDLDEAESMKIVDENVRTEKNFLKFMQHLNRQQENSYTLPYVKHRESSSEQPQSNHEHLELTIKESNIVIKKKPKNHQPFKDAPSQIEYSLHIDYPTSTTTQRPKVVKKPVVSWKDLGLDGWTGGIKEPGQPFQYK